MRLPASFNCVDADIAVVVVQAVRINDVVESLTKAAQFTFATLDNKTDVKPINGADLLRTRVNGRDPLFSSLLRVDMARRRNGVISMELPAVGAGMRGGTLGYRSFRHGKTDSSVFSRETSVPCGLGQSEQDWPNAAS